MPTYPFTEKEFKTANESWGCNCGPTALAFALQIPLDDVRSAIPDFAERGYTSPTMMRAALATLGRGFQAVRAPRSHYEMFHDQTALVRIQWTGPWTNPKPQRWAARCTHWIATWLDYAQPTVFDCNGGMQRFPDWEATVVPAITATIKRADGDWYPANVWILD